MASASVERITDYFSKLNAGADVSDDVEATIQTIFDESNDLENRELHLSTVLYSNIADPSVKFIVNLVRAVLKIDGVSLRSVDLTADGTRKVITVAGSGKKGVKTVNISTPASIVAASLGSRIVKTCAKSASSLTGSSDFFESVGGVFRNIPDTVEVFNKTNIALVSIENMVPKFDSLYGGRLLAPTVLSYALPAMITPFKTDAVLYGLSLPRIEKSIHSLHGLGYNNVMVANATEDKIHYVDELGLYKVNKVVYGRTSEEKSDLMMADPVDMLKLSDRYSIEAIRERQNRKENIKVTLDVLKGDGEKDVRDIIAVNAAAMVFISGISEDLKEGFSLAQKEISSGRPIQKLEELVVATGGTFNF